MNTKDVMHLSVSLFFFIATICLYMITWRFTHKEVVTCKVGTVEVTSYVETEEELVEVCRKAVKGARSCR